MILDAILALFEPLVGLLAGLAAGIFNLIAAGLELLVALIVPAFKIKRIERKKRAGSSPPGDVGEKSREQEAAHSRSYALTWSVIAVLAIGAALTPIVLNRKITLVAKDGHSLPHAAVILHTNGGNEHLRTDYSGNLKAPRFGLLGLTVKDPRYVEQTWQGDAITRELVVSRTVLGSGLDKLAGKLLLKAARE